MISVTWVELLLAGIFAGTLAFSVGFCVTNYARGDILKLDRKTAD